MKDVKVYAQNLRSYNIGLDQGRWITLGIEDQELQRILTEQLHLTKNHPDMALHRPAGIHWRFLAEK